MGPHRTNGEASRTGWLWSVGVLVITVAAIAGCASTPTKPETTGAAIVFAKPIDVVQKAAVDALVVTGFEVQKTEPQYVEGARPRKVGLFVGSGGETVGVWLTPVQPTRTQVQVDTARSFVGMAGQKKWDQEILAEMEKSLGKRE